MNDTLDIKAALFTATEVARAAQLDRGHVDVWVHRGVIKPTRVERWTARGRALFSVVAIFEARVIRVLGECLGIGPADSTVAAASARAILSDDWMHAIARSVENDTPLKDNLLVSVSRSEKGWRYVLHT